MKKDFPVNSYVEELEKEKWARPLRKRKGRLVSKTEQLKKNLSMKTLLWDGDVFTITLTRDYEVNGEKKKFEIYFGSNGEFALSREMHFVNSEHIETFNTAPIDMNIVYKNLKSQKSR